MSLTLAQKILKRHDANFQLKYLQEALEDEKKRRISFREWITPEVKAEFIHGEIITHSPVRKRHWYANDLLSRLLSVFVSVKNLGRVGTEKVMIGLTRNDYEPDLVFFSKEKVDKFKDDQVIFPAPDFVVEILSKGTATIDRTVKKADYAFHGIKEYWIVDPVKHRIEQYILPEGAKEYFPAKVHQSGTEIKSFVIEGFEIPVNAIFDDKINLETMKKLTKSD